MEEGFGQRTMKMEKVQHFPSVFQSTCNKNNNVKILDIFIIFYERADDIFYIYYNHCNIVFNYDSTSGMLLSQNYKGYKEPSKNFKETIQLKMNT